MRPLVACMLVAVGCEKPPSVIPRDASGAEAGLVDARVREPHPIAACAPAAGTRVRMRRLGDIGDSAVLATAPPRDGRLFVVGQTGAIWIFDNAEHLLPEPFLDLGSVPFFATGGESGLLGLAFHPRYEETGFFYVFYTTGPCPSATCANVLARYSVGPEDNKADPTSGIVLLSIPDYANNHNGGMIEFGADGYLYIGTGDGGMGGDPQGNGQNPYALLGKMLRVDVDHPTSGKAYGIPPGNPFSAGGGAAEVFMLGLRNPWRWSFDRLTGDMWIGDVGQSYFEEINVVLAAEQRGANLGWSQYEGSSCCLGSVPDQCTKPQPSACTAAGKIFPKIEWDHRIRPSGRAIVGGEVYRGSCFPDLRGTYYFTDNRAVKISHATLGSDGTVAWDDLPVPEPDGWPSSPTSFHSDARGELYETTYDGEVWRLEADP